MGANILRYRFFLFAGILPYLLGQAIAFNTNNSLNWRVFWLGFLGISLALAAVELLNEYFDAKEGGDRIFSQERLNIPNYFLPLALCSMLFAFFTGLYLAYQTGWPVILFSLLGFLTAYFYVGPPVRWAYRGWGEVAIALSYGPIMILGSYYLQSGRIDTLPIFPSLICGLSIFCLALLNEIPDYYQDRLVGKRNLVVRLGKKKSINLLCFSLACVFIFLLFGAGWGIIPLLSLVSLLFLPWLIRGLTAIKKDYNNPGVFISAINANVVFFLAITFSLGVGYLGG
jgi:1,4-dihydroxy-2-naphthoate octaprenyltransferase